MSLQLLTRSKKIAVELKNITKEYILHHQKPTLSEQVIRRTKAEKFTALHDVSLRFFQGQRVGILGRNGSGKTTLLKIIARISTPNRGEVTTYGKVVSLIDLQAGFHLDLTGEENIYLNGLIIGMSRQEVEQNFQKIVKFAGLGRFIDAPLFTYSEGMKLRLGFAIAVFASPDILILDEEIMVGDKFFQKKMNKQIDKFFQKGKTIIVVSHWLEFLEAHCERFIWVEKGKVKKDGGKEVLRMYSKTVK
jgi:ABC-type polysaccharide/polyol phosphate transport system ATPase subunit